MPAIRRGLQILKIILAMTVTTAAASPSVTKTVLFLGDSITAGYGVTRHENFPAILEARLKSVHVNLRIINGAESGALSSSLQSRLDFYARRSPKLDVVVIAAGGNDARQLSPVSEIEKNLESVVIRAKALNATVILAGMQIFTNLGADYTRDFKALYPRLAQRHKVQLIPFLLEGVAAVPALNQPDGFHPNAKGHRKIADIVEPYLEKIL